MRDKRKWILWGSIWLLLNALDYGVTYIILMRGGKEVNPFLGGLPSLTVLAVKAFLPLILIYIIYRLNKIQWLEGISVGLAVVVVYTAQWLVI